jgi:hypothetical protein
MGENEGGEEWEEWERVERTVQTERVRGRVVRSILWESRRASERTQAERRRVAMSNFNFRPLAREGLPLLTVLSRRSLTILTKSQANRAGNEAVFAFLPRPFLLSVPPPRLHRSSGRDVVSFPPTTPSSSAAPPSTWPSPPPRSCPSQPLLPSQPHSHSCCPSFVDRGGRRRSSVGCCLCGRRSCRRRGTVRKVGKEEWKESQHSFGLGRRSGEATRMT